jgi:hypothetical protein
MAFSSGFPDSGRIAAGQARQYPAASITTSTDGTSQVREGMADRIHLIWRIYQLFTGSLSGTPYVTPTTWDFAHCLHRRHRLPPWAESRGHRQHLLRNANLVYRHQASVQLSHHSLLGPRCFLISSSIHQRPEVLATHFMSPSPLAGDAGTMTTITMMIEALARFSLSIVWKMLGSQTGTASYSDRVRIAGAVTTSVLSMTGCGQFISVLSEEYLGD